MAKDAGTADLSPEQWLAIGQLFDQSRTSIQLADVMTAVRSAYRIGLAEGQTEPRDCKHEITCWHCDNDFTFETNAAAYDSDF